MSRSFWIPFSLLTVLACAPVRPPALKVASVAGVITLPTEPGQPSGCDHLSIRAFQEGYAVGVTSVHAGRGRCHYDVTQLAPGVPVTLQPVFTPPEPCGPGKLATLQPAVAELTLGFNETRTLDFRSSCGVAPTGASL
jgi:hypothetical protein